MIQGSSAGLYHGLIRRRYEGRWLMLQVLGLPTAGVRVLAANSSPGACAASCNTLPDPQKGTKPPASAFAYAAASQPCMEVSVSGPEPIVCVSEATCSTKWWPQARSVASDTIPPPTVPSAQQNSRVGLRVGQPHAVEHKPVPTVGPVSASSDDTESPRVEQCEGTEASRSFHAASGSKLTVCDSDADVHVVEGAFCVQPCAASGPSGPRRDGPARCQPPSVIISGQPQQELTQARDMDR